IAQATGALTLTGVTLANPAVTGAALFAAGSAGAPAISRAGDTNTGLFFPVADTLAVALGGSERGRWTSAGLGIGTSSPLELLHVNGTARMAELWTEQGVSIGGDHVAANFWGTGGNAALFFDKGFLGTNGAFATSLFSNGYRNNAGSFTFMGVNGNTDRASGIDLYPDGSIWLRGGPATGTTIMPRVMIDVNGNVGIGTTAPSALLDINADTTRLRNKRTIASANAAGNQGDSCWDDNYEYRCTATNTWRRVPISAW
ncbi:hypothetical protein H2509_00835, partial [Stappia sp. F7233]|nr:hypothetical protein [Stappia albiluteola]